MTPAVAAPETLLRLREKIGSIGQRYPLLFGVLVLFAVAAGIRLSEFVLTPLVFYQSGSAVCWPTDGIMLAVLLMSGRRWWPWIAAGFVVDQFLAANYPLPGILLDSFCNLLELFLAAFLLPPFRTMPEWLRQPRLIPRFLIVALFVAPLIAALLGAFYFRHIGGEKTYWEVVLRWVSSDALGFAVWTPLVLSLFSPATYAIFRPSRLGTTIPVLTLTILGSWLLFEQDGYPLGFLLFPVLVVVVNVLGFPGAVISVNAVTIIASSATIRGHGPFVILVQGEHAGHRILVLQIYLIMAIVMSFTTSLIALERQAFEEKLRQALRKMELLAKIDALTDLGNRRLFDLTLDSEWRRAYRDRTPIALLLIDADEFKQYNDRFGHLEGDACLRRIADTLSGTIKRAGDLVARYGGEEFVALLPGTRLDQAAGLAESVRQQIEKLSTTDSADGRGITVSIGCSALVPRDGLQPEALIRAADEALYAAKQRGRNCVELAAMEDSGRGLGLRREA